MSLLPKEEGELNQFSFNIITFAFNMRLCRCIYYNSSFNKLKAPFQMHFDSLKCYKLLILEAE